MTTIAEIKSAVETVRESYNKRIQKAVVDNLDHAPTIDNNGRYHAPTDNYYWINDQYYMAGEFLPNDDEYTGNSQSIRIKIATKILSEIESFLDGSMGKTWVQNNIEVGYFYAQVSSREKTALMKIIPESGKRVVLVSESGNNGNKTWIFKTSKFTRRFASLFGSEWHNIFESMTWDFAPGVEFELMVKKDGKYTYKSKFDNQEVRYDYPDNTIYN